MKKIQDEFTDLNLTNARKWQLRNPEKWAEMKAAYNRSEAGKRTISRQNKKYYEKRKSVDNSTALSGN
jgi:hypothetical protein